MREMLGRVLFGLWVGAAGLACSSGSSDGVGLAGAGASAGPSGTGGLAGAPLQAGGTTAAGGSDAGRAGSGGSSGALTNDPFWTASPVIPKANITKNVVVFSDKRWLLVIPKYGDYLNQATFVTRDAGATWTRLVTGFRSQRYVDELQFLGKGPNGELYAKWTHLDPCPECDSLGAPGVPGDTTLLTYDWDAGKFDVVDLMPSDVALTFDSQSGGTLIASGSRVWIYTSPTGNLSSALWSFDGPGHWLSIPTPNAEQMLPTADGTLYCFGPRSLAERRDGGDFQPIPLPELTEVWGIGVDPQGRLYASFTDRTGAATLVRREADSWVDVSPPSPATRFQPWVFAMSDEGILIAGTTGNDSPRPRGYISKDLGSTWVEHSPVFANGFASAAAVNAQESFSFGADSRPYFVSGDSALAGSEVVWFGPAASAF